VIKMDLYNNINKIFLQ